MLLLFDYLLLFNLPQAAISDDESPPATLTTHPPKVILKIPSYLHQLCAYMCILQNKNITFYIHIWVLSSWTQLHWHVHQVHGCPRLAICQRRNDDIKKQRDVAHRRWTKMRWMHRCCPTTRMWKDREEIAKQRRPRQVWWPRWCITALTIRSSNMLKKGSK